VYKYAEVDIDELHEHLKKDLADFDTFVRYVAEFIKKFDKKQID